MWAGGGDHPRPLGRLFPVAVDDFGLTVWGCSSELGRVVKSTVVPTS